MTIRRSLNKTRKRNKAVRQPSLYSRSEESSSQRFTFGWIIPLFVIFIFSGIFYLVFMSGVFSVDKVIFSPTKYISRGELVKTENSSRTFFDNNIITYGLFGLKNNIAKVTGVSEISFERKGSHTIYAKITEEYPLFVWETMAKRYLVSADGYIWANYEEKYKSVPVVIDTKNIPVSLESKVVPSSFVNFFVGMTTNFEAKSGTKILKIEVLDIISDIKVTTAEGWYVYFDTSRTSASELVSLTRVLTEVRAKKQPLEYVDLRIDNRIFYK